MRRVLLTAVAVAPLLALAGLAEAACPSAGASTTSTGGDIELTSGCAVTPKANVPGVTLNSSNNVTVDSGANISNVDVSNSTGIQVEGGNTGAVVVDGAISLTMSYTPTAEGNTGIAGGAFATGTNRIGIDMANGVLTGSIIVDETGSITIDGDNSVGIQIEPTGSITSDLTADGAVAVTGNATIGINVAGAVGGNVTIGAGITAQGVGARGLVTSAPIGGQLDLGASITATGYRDTTAPTVTTVLNQLGADQLQQGGAAVTVGGSVGAGILVAGTIVNGTGSTATTTAAAVISEFGSAPAIVIGAQSQSIVIGNNAADAYGLVVDGTVAAAGVYDKTDSPNLPGPVSATAIQIGLQGGGDVDLTGGIHNVGTISASALDATATGINILSGVSGQAIVNDGVVEASVSTGTAQTVQGIVIAAGSNFPTITNNGTIAATISETASNNGGIAAAIVDVSGSVSTITNTGLITAELTPTNVAFSIVGTTTAIDVSHSTTGVSISQSPSTSFDGTAQGQFTGSISGTTLNVTAVGAASGNLTVGETLYGPGITAGTTITAEGTGTGGTGTYTISTTQTVKSESLTSAGPTPAITGDILFGAGHNVMDIEAGTTTGAVTELAGQRDLTLNVAANAGTTATVDITKAEGHQVTSLNVGSGGILEAEVDPSFAVGASNQTAIFDTTVHAGQTGSDGTATFADGSQIGISLDALQTAQSAKYVFVQTNGGGELSVGAVGQALLTNAPYLYSASVSNDASNLYVTLALKTAAELGLTPSGEAAFNGIFTALEKNSGIADALISPTTKYAFEQLYNQMMPDQGIGTFESLEAATQKIANLTEQSPDAGTRIAGTSAWLQEVNETIKREDGDTLGSTDKLFGLVGGYEKMGAGGGALGFTAAYLNIGDTGTFEPINGSMNTDIAEVGAYYRRAWGNLRFSARAGGGYAWFNQRREFVSTGVTDTSYGAWNGFFGDAHLGVEYEQHISRFYIRPELSFDYLDLSEDAHSTSGAGPGFDLTVARQTSDRATAAVIVAVGTQYGHDTWFRPEIFGGYRQVVFGTLGNTTAAFTGGLPFTLTPGNVNGGWVVAGFSLKAGTPLSYVAIEGEADISSNEQRYDIYLSGRAMF
jgi:hypothetical protein